MLLETVIMGCIGVWMGWALLILAEIVPQWTRHQPAAPVRVTMPALWQGIRGQAVRDSWFTVRLITEFVSGALMALAVWQHGISLALLAVAVMIAYLLLIALIDLKYRIVPNALVYPAIVLITLMHAVNTPQTLRFYLVGGSMAFAIFYLTARLKPDTLGGGDVKLALLIGLAYGFPNMLWVLLVGAGLGGVVALYLMVMSHQARSSGIPYAPFLCFGALVGLFLNLGLVA